MTEANGRRIVAVYLRGAPLLWAPTRHPSRIAYIRALARSFECAESGRRRRAAGVPRWRRCAVIGRRRQRTCLTCRSINPGEQAAPARACLRSPYMDAGVSGRAGRVTNAARLYLGESWQETASRRARWLVTCSPWQPRAPFTRLINSSLATAGWLQVTRRLKTEWIRSVDSDIMWRFCTGCNAWVCRLTRNYIHTAYVTASVHC